MGRRSRACARMHSPDSEAHTNTSKSSSCHCPAATAPHCAWDPLQIQFPALPQARLPRTCQRLSERPNLPHAALRRTVAVAVTHSPVIESWKRKTIRSCNRDGLWLEGRTRTAREKEGSKGAHARDAGGATLNEGREERPTDRLRQPTNVIAFPNGISPRSGDLSEAPRRQDRSLGRRAHPGAVTGRTDGRLDGTT